MAEFQFPVLDAREKGSGRGFSGRFGGQRAGVAVPPLRVFKEFPCFFPVNALSEPETGSVKLRRQPRILVILPIHGSVQKSPRFRGDFRLYVRLPDTRRLKNRTLTVDLRPRSPAPKFKFPEFQIGRRGDWFDSRGDRFDFIDRLGLRPPRIAGK